MKLYVDAVMDVIKDKGEVKRPAFEFVETLLSSESPLCTNVAIYVLKLLRKKTGSYKRLNDFLYNDQKLSWVSRFKYEFEDVPQRLFFIPGNLKPEDDALVIR